MGELKQQSEHTLQRQARQAQREAKWLARWQTRGWRDGFMACVVAVSKIAAVRKWAFTHGWRAQYRMPVPVVVVGGIMIGGVGKTRLLRNWCSNYNRRVFSPASSHEVTDLRLIRERREIEVAAYSSAQQVGR